MLVFLTRAFISTPGYITRNKMPQTRSRVVVIETKEYRRYRDWNPLVAHCHSAMATLHTLFRSTDALNVFDAETLLYVCLHGDHIETFSCVLKYLQYARGGAVVALYTNPIYLLEDAVRRRSRTAVLNVLECCSFRGAAARLCSVIASGYWRAYAGAQPVHIYAAIWQRLGGDERRRLYKHLSRGGNCVCNDNVKLYFEALDRIEKMSLANLVVLDIPKES